jgi:hypothetical protein
LKRNSTKLNQLCSSDGAAIGAEGGEGDALRFNQLLQTKRAMPNHLR